MINRPPKRVTIRDASGGQPPNMPKVMHQDIRTGSGIIRVGLTTFDEDGDNPEITVLRVWVEHSCSMSKNAAAIDLGRAQVAELLEAIDEYQGRVTME